MLEASPTKPYYEGFDLCQPFSSQDSYEYIYDELFFEVAGEKENMIDIDVGRKGTLEKVMSKKHP